jgi:hypothetical protein
VLNLLDETIRTLLDTRWAAPPAKPGFSFNVPNEKWRDDVSDHGTGMRLDLYLYEVRENRNWRRPGLDPIANPDRTVTLSRPPVYLDCHYLISAWSPSETTTLLTPVEDEHEVLAATMRVLYNNPSVTPADLGVAGGGPVFQQASIELAVAPPEAPRVLNDFWSTMKLPWRPAIQLVATAPLDLVYDLPPATRLTRLVERFATVGGGTVEEWIQLGGWVVRQADGGAVADATVRHVASGRAVTTDGEGRWTMTGLRRGTHAFRASAPGLTADAHDIDVPDGAAMQHVFHLT